jgi:organic hydroperoxide reductase OsmC/OhrA
MAEHTAFVRWDRTSPDFATGRYSREHTWTFDGGITVPASPSPLVVPEPYSNPACVDPEEAFVAAVSSCHMLTFLYLAARAGFDVEIYEDRASGVMTRNAHGVPWISAITLNPHVTFRGDVRPSPSQIAALHHDAHEQCYISASIRTAVDIRW